MSDMALNDENQTLDNTNEIENDDQINAIPEEEEYKIKATNPRFVFERYTRKKLFNKDSELNDEDVITELDEEDEDIESEYGIEDALYKMNENESVSTHRVTMPEFYSRLALRKQNETVRDRALSRLSTIMTDAGARDFASDLTRLHDAYFELAGIMDSTPGLDGKDCTMHEVAVAFFDKSYDMLSYSGLSEENRIITAQKMADVMSKSYSPIGFVYGALNRYSDNYVVGNSDLLRQRLMEKGNFSKEETESLIRGVKTVLENAAAKKHDEEKSESALEPELLPWEELKRYAPGFHKQLANRVKNNRVTEQVKKQIADILREGFVKEAVIAGEINDIDQEGVNAAMEADIKTTADDVFDKNLDNITAMYGDGAVTGTVSFLAKWNFMSTLELLENKEMDNRRLIETTQKILNLVLKTYSPVAFAKSGELNKYADDYIISSESNLRECLDSVNVPYEDIEVFFKKDMKEEIIVNGNNIEKNQQNVDDVTEILSAQEEIDIPAVGEEPIVENASNNLYALNVGFNGEASIVPTEAFFKQLRDRTDDPARTAEVVSQLTDIIGEAGFADVYNDETIRYFRDAVAQTMFMISEPGQEITMTDVVKNVYSRVKVTFMNDERDPEKQAVNTQKIADLMLKNYSPVAFAGGELDEYANGYVLSNKDMFKDMLTGADTIYINASDPIDADFVSEPDRVDADPFEKIESINNNVNTLFLWDSDLVNAIVQRADDPDLIAQVNPQFNTILGEAGVAEVNHPNFAEGIRRTMVSRMLSIGEPADDKTFQMQDVTEHVFKGAYDLMRFVMSDSSEVSKIVVAQKVADVVLKNYSPVAYVNGAYDNYADNYMLKNDYLIQLALVEGKWFSEEAALPLVHELRQELVSLGIQQDDDSIGLEPGIGQGAPLYENLDNPEDWIIEGESQNTDLNTIETTDNIISSHLGDDEALSNDAPKSENIEQESVVEEIKQEAQPIELEPQREIERDNVPDNNQNSDSNNNQDSNFDNKQENEPENKSEADEAPDEVKNEGLSKHARKKLLKDRYAKMRIARKQKFKEIRKQQKELALEKLKAEQIEAEQAEAEQIAAEQPEVKQVADPIPTIIASQKAKVSYEIEDAVFNINDKESINTHIVHMPKFNGRWYDLLDNVEYKDYVRAQVATALKSRGYQNGERFPFGLLTNVHERVAESLGSSNDIDARNANMVEVASLCFRESYESLAPTNLNQVDRVITAQRVADVILKNYSHAALVNGELDQYTNNYVLNNQALLKDQLQKLNVEKVDALINDVKVARTPKLTEERMRHMFGNDVDVAKYMNPNRKAAAEDKKDQQEENPNPANGKAAPKLTEEKMRHMFGNDVDVAKYMNPNRKAAAEDKKDQQVENPNPANGKAAPKLTEEKMRHMFGNDVDVAKYMNPNRKAAAEDKKDQQAANPNPANGKAARKLTDAQMRHLFGNGVGLDENGNIKRDDNVKGKPDKDTKTEAPQPINSKARIAVFTERLKTYNSMYKLNIDANRFASSVIDGWELMTSGDKQKMADGKKVMNDLFKDTLKQAFDIEKGVAYDEHRLPEYAEIIKSSNELLRSAMYGFTDMYHSPNRTELFDATAFGGLDAKDMASLTTGDSQWSKDQKSDEAWEIQAAEAKKIADSWMKEAKPHEKMISEMKELVKAGKEGIVSRKEMLDKLTAAEWLLVNDPKMMVEDPEDPYNSIPKWGNRYWKALTETREALGVDKYTSMRDMIQADYAASAKAVNNTKYHEDHINEYVLDSDVRELSDSMDVQKEQFATRSAAAILTDSQNVKDNDVEETLLDDGRTRLSIKKLDERTLMANEAKSYNFIVENVASFTIEGRTNNVK